ncbi:LysR family transcriptional regulator [Kitasatospora phosalacinea]|uniref:LysR family transcriptional regulator n=1 Tax=Kitasatospora phosalacinea TaxID=2065 RepID=UPI00364A5A08
MQLHHLRVFAVVAAELSFTRASVRLHCAQSTVTAQIKQLERDLGVELFRRRGRCRIELTVAGALLLERVEVILQVVEETQRDLRALPGAVPRIGTRWEAGPAPRPLRAG